MKKNLIYFFIFLLLSSYSLGMGIAPARTTIDFEPGKEVQKEIRIDVDEYPCRILLSTEGDLAEYIIPEKSYIIADQKEVTVKYTIKFPNSLPPGKRLGKILAVQMPNVDSDKKEIIIATTAVIHQVWVNVPFPGKYIESNI